MPLRHASGRARVALAPLTVDTDPSFEHAGLMPPSLTEELSIHFGPPNASECREIPALVPAATARTPGGHAKAANRARIREPRQTVHAPHAVHATAAVTHTEWQVVHDRAAWGHRTGRRGRRSLAQACSRGAKWIPITEETVAALCNRGTISRHERTSLSSPICGLRVTRGRGEVRDPPFGPPGRAARHRQPPPLPIVQFPPFALRRPASSGFLPLQRKNPSLVTVARWNGGNCTTLEWRRLHNAGMAEIARMIGGETGHPPAPPAGGANA